MNALFEAQIEGISTRKDRTVVIRIGSQELPTAVKSNIFDLEQRHLKVYLSDENILPSILSEIDKTEIREEDGGKSPSQRLRGVMYRLWQMKGEPGTAENHYRDQMEIIINHYKEKLS